MLLPNHKCKILFLSLPSLLTSPVCAYVCMGRCLVRVPCIKTTSWLNIARALLAYGLLAWEPTLRIGWAINIILALSSSIPLVFRNVPCPQLLHSQLVPLHRVSLSISAAACSAWSSTLEFTLPLHSDGRNGAAVPARATSSLEPQQRLFELDGAAPRWPAAHPTAWPR